MEEGLPRCVYNFSVVHNKLATMHPRCETTTGRRVNALNMATTPPSKLKVTDVIGLEATLSITARGNAVYVVPPPGTIPFDGKVVHAVFDKMHGMLIEKDATVRFKTSSHHEIISMHTGSDDAERVGILAETLQECAHDHQIASAVNRHFPDSAATRSRAFHAALKSRAHTEHTICQQFVSGKHGLALSARAAAGVATLEVGLEFYEKPQQTDDDEQGLQDDNNENMLDNGEQIYDDEDIEQLENEAAQALSELSVAEEALDEDSYTEE